VVPRRGLDTELTLDIRKWCGKRGLSAKTCPLKLRHSAWVQLSPARLLLKIDGKADRHAHTPTSSDQGVSDRQESSGVEIWMSYQVVIVLFGLLVGVLAGCATPTQVEERVARSESRLVESQEELRLEWESRRREFLSMQQEWERFAQQYTPEVRRQLSKNVDAAITARGATEGLQAEASQDREEIASLLRQSQADAATTRRNREESAVDNVVSEFHLLREEFEALQTQWRRTLAGVEDAATQSANLARESAVSASVAAQRASDAADNARRVERQRKRIRENHRTLESLTREVRSLQVKIKALSHDLDSIQPERRDLKSPTPR
jgi:hypothetical protein